VRPLARPASPADPAVQEISPGIYAYIQPDGSWWINNAGFLTASQGITAIDTCSTQRRTAAFREAMADVSPRPVRTLINTHHHGDHTYGNYQFPGATIVAHERCRAEVLRAGPPGDRAAATWNTPEWGALQVAAPFLTFTDNIKLWADDLCCEVSHVGTPAHTDNDSVIWIPERRVLFAGDLLFNGGTPFVLAGSLAGSLRAVEALADLGAQIIVPGHGPICGPEVIGEVRGYLSFVDDFARKTHAAGLSPLEAARACDLREYADLLDSERIVGNLYRAYAELDGQQPGVPVDQAAAMRDMVAFNDGRPLTCRA
jgi:cyclase